MLSNKNGTTGSFVTLFKVSADFSCESASDGAPYAVAAALVGAGMSCGGVSF